MAGSRVTSVVRTFMYNSGTIKFELDGMDFVGPGLHLPVSEKSSRAAHDGFLEENLFIKVLIDVPLVGYRWKLLNLGLEDRVNHLSIHLRFRDFMSLKVIGFPRQFSIGIQPSAELLPRTHQIHLSARSCKSKRPFLTLGALLLDEHFPAIDHHRDHHLSHFLPRRIVSRKWIGRGFLPALVHWGELHETLARAKAKQVKAQ